MTKEYTYYIEQTRGYFVSSDVPLNADEAQVLVENGVGSLKIVEWKVVNTDGTDVEQAQ